MFLLTLLHFLKMKQIKCNSLSALFHVTFLVFVPPCSDFTLKFPRLKFEMTKSDPKALKYLLRDLFFNFVLF